MSKPGYRYRPLTMRLTGWAVLLLGIVTIALNIVMEFDESVTLLPGGHSPLYLLGGAAIAVIGVWWTGIADAK